MVFLKALKNWLFSFKDRPTDPLPLGFSESLFSPAVQVVEQCLRFNGFDENGDLTNCFYPSKVDVLNYQQSLEKIICRDRSFTEENVVKRFIEAKEIKPNLTPKGFASSYNWNLKIDIIT